MIDITINYNEDPDELKSMNCDEPVLELHTPYSHTVIPASRVCYHEIKRELDAAEGRIRSIEKMEALRDTP